ncbi:MAG: hypothetical protein NWE83_14110 [Candidatus Bathyarchaeota archaeon]|nr:hypothetical protein [Candidatus Bathyarchaeota archaeon]
MEYVEDMMAESIVWVWEKVRPIMLDERDVFNIPRLFENFEFLYHEVKKLNPESINVKL